METTDTFQPAPDAVITWEAALAAPGRPGTVPDGPAKGRVWALVRMVEDGRLMWADIPAGIPVRARVAERFRGMQPADTAVRIRLGEGARAAEQGVLLDHRRADAAERAFAWGVLLASDAAIADIHADARQALAAIRGL